MITILCAPASMRTIVDGFLASGAFNVVQPNLSTSGSIGSFVCCITTSPFVAKHIADDLAQVMTTLGVARTRSIVADGAPYLAVQDLESSMSVVDFSIVDETNSAYGMG